MIQRNYQNVQVTRQHRASGVNGRARKYGLCEIIDGLEDFGDNAGAAA